MLNGEFNTFNHRTIIMMRWGISSRISWIIINKLKRQIRGLIESRKMKLLWNYLIWASLLRNCMILLIYWRWLGMGLWRMIIFRNPIPNISLIGFHIYWVALRCHLERSPSKLLESLMGVCHHCMRSKALA